MNHPRFSYPDNYIISAILMSGFGLRLIGINVGLPDAPDPREIIIAQDVLNLIHFTAVPQIYNWPGTAWFYLIALIGKLLSLGGVHLTEARVILSARGVNLLLSTATLWLTYCIGLRCYSRQVGQIAAGLLAIAMLHATNESRFALVDIPATFCVTLFLWGVVRTRASSDVPTFQTAVRLGIIAGLGFAVKFTTVFVGLSLLCFIGSKGFYRRLATIIGVSVLTFTLLCPYWLIDLISPEWNLFFEDFWYEATHYHRGHFGLIATGDAGWLQRFIYLWTLLKWGMGLPLALLVTFAVAFKTKLAIRSSVLPRLIPLRGEMGKFPTLEASLLAFVIPYLLFIGAHKVKFARHLLILYPALTVLASATLTRFPYAIEALFRFVHPQKIGNSENPAGTVFSGQPSAVNILRKRFSFVERRVSKTPKAESRKPKALPGMFGKWSGIIVGSVIVLYTSVYTAAFALVLIAQPTRIAASEWISKHIPQEESISRAPEILFDWLLPELDLEAADDAAKWVLILVPDLEVFQKYQRHPQNYQNQDWYPLDAVKAEETLVFYERILGKGSPYVLHKIFRCTPQFLGIQISDSGAPFPMRALAHSELRLYHRRD